MWFSALINWITIFAIYCATISCIYSQSNLGDVVNAGSNIGNIFHWNINEKNTVKFAAKEWGKLSLAEKKQLDIQKIATQYSATHMLVNMKIL